MYKKKISLKWGKQDYNSSMGVQFTYFFFNVVNLFKKRSLFLDKSFYFSSSLYKSLVSL